MAALGDLLGLAHVLKRAYDLYTGCQAAPQEIQLAADHIHTMALVLEGVKTDLLKNRHSFVHQKNDLAKARTQNLKYLVGQCDRSLQRMGKLLGKYRSMKKGGHVSIWDKFRWSTEGKKEIAECKADLVLSTSMLDLFLSKEGLSVLWKLESMMETMMKRFEALELFQQLQPVNGNNGARRPRSGSNVGRTLVLSLVLARLRRTLLRYRRKKANNNNNNNKKTSNPGPRRHKLTNRTNSGFKPSKQRNQMLQNYANNIAASASKKNPTKPQRTRTPSPDFYYIPGPRPVRRSSSMNRLLDRINAKKPQPKVARDHYECWRVGIGRIAIGGKTAPVFLPHRRGQLQLRKMAQVYQEAQTYDGRGLNERDGRVKAILKEQNDKEKKRNTGRKWYLVAARIVARDPGKTGFVSVEKAMIILVRR